MFMNTKRMGRPRKPDAERKDVDLRIPVTAQQKATIMKAVETTQLDMATWARMILLEHAAKLLRKK